MNFGHKSLFYAIQNPHLSSQILDVSKKKKNILPRPRWHYLALRSHFGMGVRITARKIKPTITWTVWGITHRQKLLASSMALTVAVNERAWVRLSLRLWNYTVVVIGSWDGDWKLALSYHQDVCALHIFQTYLCVVILFKYFFLIYFQFQKYFFHFVWVGSFIKLARL